jgi:hypothetical protein
MTLPPDLKGDEGAARDTALELLKQLITLAAATLALSATFLEKLPPISLWHIGLVALSWTCLVSSLICALHAISSMIQRLRRPELGNWAEGSTKTFARWARLLFVVGLGALAAFAVAVALVRRTLTSL